MNNLYSRLMPFFAPEGDPPAGSATPAPTPTPAPEPTPTPPSIDDLQNSVSASRRREAEAQKSLKEATDRLAALEAEDKKRKEAEMTEVEKAQAAAAEAQKQISELTGYKERWEGYEKRQSERVTKELEGLTDQQKAIVEKLANPDDQLEAITQFKATQPGRLDVAGGAGARTTNKLVSQLNKEELAAEFEKYKKGAS